MPLRKIDFMSSVLALAEPVPFTVAILMEKSLTRAGVAGGMVVLQAILGCCAGSACASSSAFGHGTSGLFDAQLGAEHRLHVAVEAALHFLLHLLGGEAQLDLDVELLEAFLERDVRHEAPLDGCVVVGVTPLVHAHLAAL